MSIEVGAADVSNAHIAAALAIALFAWMTFTEARRIRRFLKHGIKTEGQIVDDEMGPGIGIGRIWYPIVQFQDQSGMTRRARSLISRDSRTVTYPEKVIVRYLPENPAEAELFSGFHPYKHLVAISVVLILSSAFAVYALPR